MKILLNEIREWVVKKEEGSGRERLKINTNWFEDCMKVFSKAWG